MLKKFMVTNFKNFKDTLCIEFDSVGGYQFNSDCLCNDTIGKMIIYGRNATGKTNLGDAILDIAMLPSILMHHDIPNFLNADSNDKVAKFLYVFQFENDIIEYQYEKYSFSQYKSERLFLNSKEVFFIDYSEKIYNFNRLDMISAETINTNVFIQAANSDLSVDDTPAVSFLRWIFTNSVFNKNLPIFKLMQFIKNMKMLNISSTPSISHGKYNKFLNLLFEKELSNFEDFLNCMGIECKLICKKLPDGQIELYFKKNKLVPFLTASSGTKKLYEVYAHIISSLQDMSFCYMDEFDAFFHYEMSEKFVKFFKEKYPRSQIVFTTHNTNLMSNSIMRPDCLFILSREGRLTPLNKATKRELREGHNLEKMYISGEFNAYE